jgi:hypothetical protein
MSSSGEAGRLYPSVYVVVAGDGEDPVPGQPQGHDQVIQGTGDMGVLLGRAGESQIAADDHERGAAPRAEPFVDRADEILQYDRLRPHIWHFTKVQIGHQEPAKLLNHTP